MYLKCLKNNLSDFPIPHERESSHKHMPVISFQVTVPTFSPHQSFRFLYVGTLKKLKSIHLQLKIKRRFLTLILMCVQHFPNVLGRFQEYVSP